MTRSLYVLMFAAIAAGSPSLQAQARPQPQDPRAAVVPQTHSAATRNVPYLAGKRPAGAAARANRLCQCRTEPSS